MNLPVYLTTSYAIIPPQNDVNGVIYAEKYNEVFFTNCSSNSAFNAPSPLSELLIYYANSHTFCASS